MTMATMLPITFCPCCGHTLDCATPVDGVMTPPQEGDLSVCINCATPLQFDANLKLVALSDDEMAQLPPLSAIELRQAVKSVKHVKGL